MRSAQEVLLALFRFRKVPTTLLVFVVYATIFIGVIVSEQVPPIPTDTPGLDLEEAYTDLHKVSALRLTLETLIVSQRHPQIDCCTAHPVISRANDVVRSYILSRIRNITDGFAHAEVVDDLDSTAAWFIAGHGVSFEGSNILVKVEGTDPAFSTRGGVLFSAHFDSVSTAPGTTDDGMGVVTLMQLIKNLMTQRTRRTAVFNMNNGEEDGLNGAHAFLEHPWSKIPDTFLNLEGAAAGGRPLLFRATSIAPVLSFKNRNVLHPHGNVLSADAFSRGVVRSGTDYAVYSLGLGPDTAMEGIDFAFYQGRSKYHTRFDSIPGANGGKRSLWAMMDTVKGAGLAMLNEDRTHIGDGTPTGPVYFDLFGRSFIVFSQRSLFVFNIVMSIAGPIALLLLYRAPGFSRVSNPQVSTPDAQKLPFLMRLKDLASKGAFWRDSDRPSILKDFKELRWLKLTWWKEAWARSTESTKAHNVWRVAKFWVALAVGILLQVLLILTILSANRYIIYSQPYVVLISNLTLAFLSTVGITRICLPTGGPQLPDQHKSTMLIQTYILSWLLLIIGTVILNVFQIGGVYFLTAWNLFAFLSCAVTCVGRIIRISKTRKVPSSNRSVFEDDEGHQLSEHASLSPRLPEHEAVVQESFTPLSPKAKPTENTPLMAFTKGSPLLQVQEESGAAGWWILELLLAIPIPIVLISHILLLFLSALDQTLSDGNSPTIVYGGTAILSFFMAFLLAPFSVKIERWVVTLAIVIFAISTVYIWAAFPFSQEAPLKVFFQQQLQLNISNPTGPALAITTLTGVPRVLSKEVVPQLPSSWGKPIQCSTVLAGTETCGWQSDLVPSLSQSNTSSTPIWLVANATRLSGTSALIRVSGTNTRSCRLYFDSHNVTAYDVYVNNSDGTASPSRRALQAGYEMPPSGISSLYMWSRTWGNNFTVEVTWADDGKALLFRGRIVGEWAEYESTSAGADETETWGGKIPALEEVLAFLPKWSVVSKLSEGLVEAGGSFAL